MILRDCDIVPQWQLRVLSPQTDFGERNRMSSSSTSFPSLPRRPHTSSISSTSSAASAHEVFQPPRRLTLTIPPLRIKPLNQPAPPKDDVVAGPSNGAPVAPKLPTKIRLKPRASVSVAPTPVVESPVAGPSVPLPPPIIEKPKPPPRPVKLKPLREVLYKLIAQIKR